MWTHFFIIHVENWPQRPQAWTIDFLNDTLTCTTLDLCYNDQANSHIILVILLNVNIGHIPYFTEVKVKFISINDPNHYHLDHKLN